MKVLSIKILGISLLALIGIMAVGASGAQAKWLLLLNGASVSKLNLVVDVLPAEKLVPDLGIAIGCTGGTAHVTVQTVEESKNLTGEGSVELTGCTVLGSEEVCEVHSPGQPDGIAILQGSGVADMEGAETVTTKLESVDFIDLEFDGEECSISELDARCSGTAKASILEALKDLTNHLVLVDDESIFFGVHKAELHSPENSAIVGHGGDENPNATVAVHLVEL